MKKITVTLLIVLISASIFLFSCEENANVQEPQKELIDNSQSIKKIIESFDKTFRSYKANPNLSEAQLNSIFTKRLNNIATKGANNYVPVKIEKPSEEYLNFLEQISHPQDFVGSQDYREHIAYYSDLIKESKMSIKEKQALIDKICLMTQFTRWIEGLEFNRLVKKGYKPITLTKGMMPCHATRDCPPDYICVQIQDSANVNVYIYQCVPKPGIPGTEDKPDDWWDSWGKCVAAILSGTGTGALTGGASGSVIPGLGTTAGAIIGAIFGGLGGASLGC